MLKWLRGNYPLLISTNINSSNGYAPASVLKNGIPLITAPDFSSGVVPIGGQIVVNSFIPDQWKRGYVQSWNLTL
ncbi:MAG: hypothetical protein ABI165_19610 [Bryobacteraceae bacterium]